MTGRIRASWLWLLRLGVGLIGFLAALGFLIIVFVGGDDSSPVFEAAFVVTYVTLLASIAVIMAIELAQCVVLILLFVGRKTGVLRILT